MPARERIDRELAAVLSHPLVASAEVVRQDVTRRDGYLRLRCRLVNDDYLEVALHVTVQTDAAVINSYRYQWMDAAQLRLRRRWDNSPHYPFLPGFSHHCHVASETSVEPADLMHLGQLLDTISDLML